MSVLAREAAAYQTAVDQYQRDSQGFQDSLLKDANGNILVYMGGRYYTVPMSGGTATPLNGSFTTADGRTITADQLSSYGTTTSSGDPNVQLVRQNPTGTTTSTISGLQALANDSGDVNYYARDADGYLQMYVPPIGSTVQYQLVPSSDPTQQPTYQAIVTSNQYIGEPNEFTRKPPDPTNAQLRRMREGSLADFERSAGLDTGIIRGAGLKGGLRPPPKPAGSVDTGIDDPQQTDISQQPSYPWQGVDNQGYL